MCAQAWLTSVNAPALCITHISIALARQRESGAYWEEIIECVYTDLYTVTLHMSKQKAWSNMRARRRSTLNGVLSVIGCVCESSAYHDALCFVCVNGTCWSNILWSLEGGRGWYEVEWPSYITGVRWQLCLQGGGVLVFSLLTRPNESGLYLQHRELPRTAKIQTFCFKEPTLNKRYATKKSL